MLETPEPSVLAENAKRYQLQALLIVNGNRASANYDNPYTELADLFQSIEKRLDADAVPSLISQRLTNVAATYYNASYGANGTGHVRACFATSYEQLVVACDRIERFVNDSRAGATK